MRPTLPLDDAAIARGYREGLSLRQLARVHGTNHTTILTRLRAAGVERRAFRAGRVFNEDELRALHAEHRSVRKLAEVLQAGRHQVYRALRKAGIVLRKTKSPATPRVKWPRISSLPPDDRRHYRKLRQVGYSRRQAIQFLVDRQGGTK